MDCFEYEVSDMKLWPFRKGIIPLRQVAARACVGASRQLIGALHSSKRELVPVCETDG